MEGVLEQVKDYCVHGSLKNSEGQSVIKIMCRVKIEGKLISSFFKYQHK